MPLDQNILTLASGQIDPAKYAELLRNQQIGQALLQQGMQPLTGQMVSGRFVAPSWTQRLAGLGNVYYGNKLVNDANAQLYPAQAAAMQSMFGDSQPKPDPATFSSSIPPNPWNAYTRGMMRS